MKLLVTGSAGHLGEALARSLRAQGHEVIGLDVLASAETTHVGSIADRPSVAACMPGVDAVFHTATLHKPHVQTHSRQAFVDTNITGTLNLLEEAVLAKASAFIFTSTTSIFGDSLRPPPGEPAAWITEDVPLQPKNIYGATKAAAEDLCQLFHRNQQLPCLVLRTSRFFPESDDDADRRDGFEDRNLKVIELLYRRVDLHDVVTAHLDALKAAPRLGFGKFIISGTSPFTREDLPALRGRAGEALRGHVPGFEAVFAAQGWRMLDDIDRVYVNDKARALLGWRPEYDFARALADVAAGRDPRSEMARATGIKGYHRSDAVRSRGVYPFVDGTGS
jgi:UDP-glucose 4-epimerase